MVEWASTFFSVTPVRVGVVVSTGCNTVTTCSSGKSLPGVIAAETFKSLIVASLAWLELLLPPSRPLPPPSEPSPTSLPP